MVSISLLRNLGGVDALVPHFERVLIAVGGNKRHIKEEQPLVFRPRKNDRTITNVHRLLASYRATLPADRRTLLERFRLVDVAIKVVGVGSVGTRCAVALLMAGEDDTLFLQFKEARASVLEPYAGRNPYSNHRSEDPVLRVDFYVRQLRDCKTAANIDTMDYPHLVDYARHCGAALARAILSKTEYAWTRSA